jgi:hypothetical protein
MHAELTIVARYDRQRLCDGLIEQIGANRVSSEVAVKGSVFERDLAGVRGRIIAAEVIGISASIIYFFEGADTVTVHITAATVTKLKAQATRITRQMGRLFSDNHSFAAEVSIFAREKGRLEELIVKGEYIPKRKRFTAALTEKWLDKLLTPAAVFFLGTLFLPGSTEARSAIALGAASISFVIQAALFACTADEWTWRNAK